MDDRKRTYEPNEGGTGQLKRLRPEDILGIQRDEPHKVVTRLFLSRSNYSKVIGRGGQMIVQIRAFTGASLRCSELDEDNRLVLIIGNLVQVLNAFDVIIQVISPMVVQANSSGQRPLTLSSAASGNQGEPVTVCLLLEQGKTGRVVGSKGSTLLALKQRSGAVVRVEKETTEYCGVELRKVSVEGGNQSIRLVHYLLHELFVDPHVAAIAVDNVPHLRVFSSNGGGGGGGAGGEDLSLRPYMPAGANSGPNREFNARDTYTRESYGSSSSSSNRDTHSSHHGRDSSSYRDGYRDSGYRDNSRERDRVSRRDPYYDSGGDSLAMSSFGRSLPGPGALRSTSPDPSPYRTPHTHTHAHTGGSAQASRYGPASGSGTGGVSDHPVKSVPLYVNNAPHVSQQQLQQHQHHHESPVLSQIDHSSRRGFNQATPVTPITQPPKQPHHHQQQDTTEADVPFPALVGYGVPPETVKQLIDMQAYLLQQFGLKLGTTKRVSAPQIDTFSSSASSGAALARIRRDSATEDPRESFRTTPAGALPLTADADQTVDSVLAQKRETNPRDLYFAIPRACVGGVIGRGGQLLRDMQAEFNVKVYVEKEEYSGQRIVRLTYLGGSGSSMAMTSSGRAGTVKRSAAESDNDEGETDRHGHDAHKRNRRDESINREAEGQGDQDVNMDNKNKEGTTATTGGTSTSSTRPSNGPAAPKRKGTSEGEEGLDGDEGGNVSKKVRDSSSNSNNTSSCKTGGRDRSTAVEEAGAGGELQQQQAQQQTQQHGEEEEGGDEAESRLKRKRGDATEPMSHTVSSLGAGSDVTDTGLPLRALMLCKERIEARIEELLQKQIAEAASI